LDCRKERVEREEGVLQAEPESEERRVCVRQGIIPTDAELITEFEENTLSGGVFLIGVVGTRKDKASLQCCKGVSQPLANILAWALVRRE